MEDTVVLIAVGVAVAIILAFAALIEAVGARKRAAAAAFELRRLRRQLLESTVESREAQLSAGVSTKATSDTATESSTEPSTEPSTEESTDLPTIEAEESREAEPVAPPAVETPRVAAGSRWDEQVGVRLPVWIGGVSLALAGLFLVRYAVTRGLLTPEMRVLASSLFGLAMLGTGEFLRTRERKVGQSLTAAGVAVWFGAVLASLHLYHFIGPTVGFVLLVFVTVVAVLLSLRQGPFVALLGLVGGFLTPALIGVGEVSGLQVFGFLLLLQTGLVYLTRRQRWDWLTLVTLVGAYSWAGYWWLFRPNWEDPTVLFLFLIATAALFVLSSAGSNARVGAVPIGSAVPWSSVGLSLLIGSGLVQRGDFRNFEWMFLGILGAGCLALGALRSRYEGLSWAAFSMTVGLQVIWLVDLVHAEALRFSMIALGTAALYGGVSYAICFFKKSASEAVGANDDSNGREPGDESPNASPAEGTSSLLGRLSALAWVVGVFLARGADADLPWVMIYAGASALAVIGAALLGKHRERTGIVALTWHSTAAAVLAASTIAEVWEGYRVAIGWSMLIGAVAYCARRFQIPGLRWSLLFGVLAVCLVLVDQLKLLQQLDTAFFLNWSLPSFGLAIAATLLAAFLLRRTPENAVASWLETIGLLLLLGYLWTTIHHGVHRERCFRGGVGFFEFASFSQVAILLGIVLRRAQLSLQGFRRFGEIGGVFVFFGTVMVVLGSCWIQNPLLDSSIKVGWYPIANGVLFEIGRAHV